MDRIDIQVEVNSVKYESFESDVPEEKSEVIRARVEKTRKIQLDRYKKEGIFSNSELTPKLIEKYCVLDEKCKLILQKAFNKLRFECKSL